MASASLAGPRPQSPSPSPPSPPFSSSQTALQPKKLRTLQQVSLSTHRRKGSSSSSIMTKTQPPHRSPYYTRTRLLHQLGIAPQQPPKQGCSTATTGSSPVEISCLASEYAPSSSSSSHNHHHNHQSMLGGMVPFETKLNDSEEFYAHADAHAAADHGDGDERSSSSAPQHQPQPSLFHDHLHPTSSISTSSSSMSVSMTSSSKSSSSSSSNKNNRLQFKETVQVLPIPSRYQYSDRIKQCIWSNRYELQEMAQRNLQEFASENYDWRNVVLDEDMYIDASSSSSGGPPQLIHPCHLQPNYNNTSTTAAAAVSSNSDGDETKNGHEPEEDQEDDDDDDDAHFAPLQKFESFVTAGQ